jgi:hypothetical protein
MTSFQIANALVTLKPGAQWKFDNADLSTIVWLDTIQTQPTNDEITAQIAAQGE